MPNNTPNYQLEYFKRGSNYSAASDYRRFVTLDYNLESYVGVVGIGIISGWQIQESSGLIIKILPGDGIISGYYSESPYIVEQRSDMVPGDREIYAYRDEDGVPEPDLTPAQRAYYVSVVQLYNPSFNPVGSIENSYVKVVVPSNMTLTDNADNYIYAKRPSGAKPYPLLSDFPALPGPVPVRSDYSDYFTYKDAMDVYNAKLATIHAYHWDRDSTTGDPHENHFTEVQFYKSLSFVKSSSMVLLGRVVTRNGIVSKIDTSGVDRLANFYSVIKEFADTYISNHEHGGSGAFDPPHIDLETDMRDCILSGYNVDTGRLTYNVLESTETSTTLGHKHTYFIDSDGNGQTIEQIGSQNSHFHKISEYTVQTQELSALTVTDHIHTISSSQKTWDADSQYVVYLNDAVFADETSTNVDVDYTKKTITILNGASISLNTYSCTFLTAFGSVYSYTNRFPTVFEFMLSMSLDFNSKYEERFSTNLPQTLNDSGDIILGTNSYGEDLSAIQNNILNNNPFVIFVDGKIVGFNDLKQQSMAAQSLLNKEGDKFTFTPNAANDITIELIKLGYNKNGINPNDEVIIEILGNAEVTGILKTDSIIYLNANKIALGEFDIERIPFISHIGRFEESFLPFQYNLVSNDGIKYYVSPTLTKDNLNHYHRLLLDKTETGSTADLMINGEVDYYAQSNNTSYFIMHYHSVEDAVLSPVNNSNVTAWQNSLNNTNNSSSTHLHEIIYPTDSNSVVVYEIKEDAGGNIYAGTSDGLILIPNESAYEFTINNSRYYLYGSDLWDMFKKAVALYEEEQDKYFYLDTATYYDQVLAADEALITNGMSYLITGPLIHDQKTDKIMIKKVEYFNIPNFNYTVQKDPNDILETETILSNVASSSGLVTVQRDFNNTPIWSLIVNPIATTSEAYVVSVDYTDIVAIGSDVVATARTTSLNQKWAWANVPLPFSIGVTRKGIKSANNDYWFATNSGVFIARSYNNGSILTSSVLPDQNPDIKDIVEISPDVIGVVSDSGLYQTSNGGKSWSKLYDVIGGFKSVHRDYTQDVSSVVNGHYHNVNVNNVGNGFLEESIGSGERHVHQVSWWTVQSTLNHTHSIISTLYLIDNNKVIYKSINSGVSWSNFGTISTGEYGVVFAAYNKILVAKQDGLYMTENGEGWKKVLDGAVYSCSFDYELQYVLCGLNGKIYRSLDAETFELAYTLGGVFAPMIVNSNANQYYEYAYSNKSLSFHFKDITVTTDNIAGLVDFNKWYALEGGWNSKAPYDVYVDYKRVLSTKYDEDKRISKSCYFNVNTDMGIVDFFVETKLTSSISVYDNAIYVIDSTGFYAGDTVEIHNGINRYFAVIASVGTKQLILTQRIAMEFNKGAKVTRMSNLNGDSSVILNVYDSILSDIGTFTHEQIEDKLSTKNDFRPYKFNNSYLSNLLQITQAVRYVYPSINSEFIQSQFYDFKYSLDPADPVYPYIRDYIDTLTTAIYSQKVYDNSFAPKFSGSVNDVLIGYGTFANIIFVATDIGIFWSRISANFERNWFYVNNINTKVYNLLIYGGTRLLAATDLGLYYTDDVSTWVLESSSVMDYQMFAMALRWESATVIETVSHEAWFYSDVGSNTGYIVAKESYPYTNFLVNRGIKVTGAGEKDGQYIISNISTNGGQLTVTPSFTGGSAFKTGVTITMGTWWQQWDGDENLSNANLTNTLIVGGKDNVTFNNGLQHWSWFGGNVDVENFSIRNIFSASSGVCLSSATGDGSNLWNKNYLLNTYDLGKTWEEYHTLEPVSGTISSSEITDANNTQITVQYLSPVDFITSDCALDQREIVILAPGTSNIIGRGRVVNNDSQNKTITIYGNALDSIIIPTSSFIVYPSKINVMMETTDHQVLFGMDTGIYQDNGSIVKFAKPSGSILNAGINGIVEDIDLAGEIVAVDYSASRQNSTISIKFYRANASAENLVGYKFYITDTDPVEEYTIIANSSVSITDEVVVQSNIPVTYVGKKFVIVGNHSRLYINFDLPVLPKTLNGGTLYLINGETGILGKTYKVLENNSEYVEIYETIKPISTFRGNDSGMETEEVTITATDVTLGQRLRFVDSDGYLTLWVSLGNEYNDNYFVGKKIVLNVEQPITTTTTTTLSSTVALDMTSINENEYVIAKSTKNSLSLKNIDPLSFEDGMNFSISGFLFDPLDNFNHKLTSVESAHYHGLNLVGGKITGEVVSFGTHNTSYVTINVGDTTNFNIPIVQLSGDLLHDARIVFTNMASYNLRYVSQVVSHTVSSITVRLISSNYWNFSSYDELKISDGWKWEIDGTNYGYTAGTYYEDFAVISNKLTSDFDLGTDLLYVEDTTGIMVDDKIMIQDQTLSYEINYVAQVVNSTTLRTTNNAGRTYSKNKNSQIKVLRDSFANTHMHQVRNNEILPVTVQAYLDRGYPSEHSHRCLPYLTDVSVLLNRNNSIIAAGSDSIVYTGSTTGNSWTQLVDLNDYLEGDPEEIEGVSAGTIYNNNLVLGTTNGNIFVEGVSGGTPIIKTTNPLI